MNKGCIGFDWNTKNERKNRVRSQTPGKQKGINCQATVLDRFFAKTSRSYKHKGYAAWIEKCRKLNKQGGIS